MLFWGLPWAQALGSCMHVSAQPGVLPAPQDCWGPRQLHAEPAQVRLGACKGPRLAERWLPCCGLCRLSVLSPQKTGSLWAESASGLHAPRPHQTETGPFPQAGPEQAQGWGQWVWGTTTFSQLSVRPSQRVWKGVRSQPGWDLWSEARSRGSAPQQGSSLIFLLEHSFGL